MTMSEAQRVFTEKIEAALEEYIATQVDPEDILADWSVVYSRQKIDDDGDIAWANSVLSKRGMNPNGHIALHAWGSSVISDLMMDTERDEDE